MQNNAGSSEIVRSLGEDSSSMTFQFIALLFLPFVSQKLLIIKTSSSFSITIQLASLFSSLIAS